MGYGPRNIVGRREERPWKVHPAWRGIGCFLIILVPIMAWFGSIVFIENNTFVPIPRDFTRVVRIGMTDIPQINQVIYWFNSKMIEYGISGAIIFFWLAFIFLGFGLLAILYGIMYKFIGPPRYGPYDVPPLQKGPRR